MKRIQIITVLLLLIALAVPAFAKSQKKPASVYVKTAKIELSNDNKERWDVAIAFLDTLFMHYGPTDEGLFLMREAYTKFVDNTGDLKKKAEYVKKMAVYIDSLELCCSNEEIDGKNKKKCKELLKANKEIRTKYWTDYYNAGVEQVKEIQKVSNDALESTDSTEKKYYDNRLQSLLDTCEVNMNMAISLDNTDHRPYAGLASVYTSKGDPAKANEWLIKALEFTQDRTLLLQDIAYSFINQDKYCEAIPYLAEYSSFLEPDTAKKSAAISSLYNLSVCYNNCQQYEEASQVYHRILALDENYAAALSNLGRFHRSIAQKATDSVRQYEQANNMELTEKWKITRDSEFDSTLYYLKKVFDIKLDDEQIAEEYAIINYIREKYDAAIDGFKRVAELSPDKSDNWLSLGDCYIFLEDYKNAIGAYEKFIAIKPNNKNVLENLVELYKTTGDKAKSKEMADRLKSL